MYNFITGGVGRGREALTTGCPQAAPLSERGRLSAPHSERADAKPALWRAPPRPLPHRFPVGCRDDLAHDEHPNVYVDASAYKVTRFPADLVTYMRGPGRRKVLFGTNYPMLTPSECLAGIESLDLSPEGRSQFTVDNARRAFKLAT
jgi:hypothetical protein